MTNWTDTITQLSAVIRTGADFPSGEIICSRYSRERGIEVYRNNYRGNLHDALSGAYPVIRLLVGEEFFRWLAKCFIEKYPSRSGNMHRYGSEMPEFLANFENTQHLAYLPDMARLEWAYHHSYFADDVMPFDLTSLAMVAPESYGELCWHLNPGCTLLTSVYPIAAIWQAHQNGAPEDIHIDLNSSDKSLLVYRNALSVKIIHIAAASHHWLMLLQQGNTMGIATNETLSIFPDFDLATTLRHWLAQGVLINFDTSNVTPSKTYV